MSLLQKIKTELDSARKEKNQTLLTILITLYGEASAVGKTKRNGDSTDEEVISVIKKFKLGVEEIQKIKGTTTLSVLELIVYDSFLPRQMSEDELLNHIELIVADVGKDPKNMGKVMAALKSNFAGLYDGTLASQLTKQALA